MAQSRWDYAKFEERKTFIVVIGPIHAAAFERYFKTKDLPFIGLPDATHTVLKRYGQEIKLVKF